MATKTKKQVHEELAEERGRLAEDAKSKRSRAKKVEAPSQEAPGARRAWSEWTARFGPFPFLNPRFHFGLNPEVYVPPLRHRVSGEEAKRLRDAVGLSVETVGQLLQAGTEAVEQFEATGQWPRVDTGYGTSVGLVDEVTADRLYSALAVPVELFTAEGVPTSPPPPAAASAQGRGPVAHG